MGSRFEYFDPLKDELPYWPYSRGSGDILRRARLLVIGRSRKEIEAIAAEIDFFLDDVIEQEKSNNADIDEDYLDYIKDNFVVILKDIIHAYDLSVMEVENVSPAEVFGSLALSLLDDFVFTRNFSIKNGKVQKRGVEDPSSASQSMMADALLQALDAVTHGELLKAQSDLSARYEEMIDQIRFHASEVEKTQIEQLESELKAKWAAEVAARRSSEMAARNEIRHARTRKWRKKVEEWYDEERNNFPSAAQAAKHFCRKIEELDKGFEQRTVERWIREHSKKKGYRFRP